jgi:hypothetical protein
MAVPGFVDQIFGGHLSQRTEPLWAIGSHPDEIAGGDRVPAITEALDALTFEHQEPMLHDV